MSWKKTWSVIEDYRVITFGVFVYVLAWTAFMIPNGVASGGLTGACTILEMGTGIPVAYSYVIINAILIVVGSLILGRGFGFKTIYAILLATLLFDLLLFGSHSLADVHALCASGVELTSCGRICR